MWQGLAPQAIIGPTGSIPLHAFVTTRSISESSKVNLYVTNTNGRRTSLLVFNSVDELLEAGWHDE